MVHSALGVIVHARPFVEAAVGQVAVDIYVHVGDRKHLQFEMNHGIVGLHVRIGSVVFAHKEAPVLGLVVAVGDAVARSGHVQHVVIVGVDVFHVGHPHARICELHRLHAAVFVAGGENQLRIMLEDGAVARHPQRMGDHDRIVGASVLADHHAQVVVDVADGVAVGINREIHLLVGAVEVDVGLGAHLAADVDHPFADHEAHLQESIVGVILRIDFQQVVAGDGETEVAVGQRDGIMDVVGGSGVGEFVVLHVGEVEPVEHFAVDQRRGRPVGVAMIDAVTQVVALLGEDVEADLETVGRIERDDGRSQPVAFYRYCQGLHPWREDARGRILHGRPLGVAAERQRAHQSQQSFTN